VLNDPSKAADRFVVESRIGGGASGDIYKALDTVTNKAVAVKVLRRTATEGEKERFVREIAVLADLRHPNIVEFVSHGKWPDGRLFLSMEWLDGEDLSKRQRRAPLGTRDSVEVVRRTAQALAAIHSRGIVHRDLKLSNMFLVKGRGTAVKLIDFGVVQPAIGNDGEFETAPGTILGTPHYMAPEQARGETVDPRADVYALGSVLFRLLTGRNVFETEHVIALLGRLVLEDPPRPSQFRFDIPDKLDLVVHSAISRNKDERYSNAGDFARALARVGQLNNDPPHVERSASQVRPRRMTKTDTGTTGNRPTRPGLRMRRVVACMVYDLGDTNTEHSIGDTLTDIAGEDVRIENLAGGKTVAVLGVEHSLGDEVMRAARAALEIVREYPLARAVVTTGHAVMARANLAGEALDRAAQQLDKATAGAIRLDLHAAAALEMRFEVKRDAEGALLIREDPRDLAPRNVLGQPTPTVGREKEIAELQALYGEMLRDSFPRAALVTGSAGIGKSRVRSELTQRLELAPVPPERLFIRGDARARDASLSVLGKALRNQMGVQDGGELKEQMQLVRRYVRARLPRSLHFLGAFLGELVGVPFPDQNDEPLRAARANDQLMQSRIRMALEAWLRTQAGRIPQVFVLEDAQWADDTTIELIDWVLACPDIRFCVFAFAESEIEKARPQLWANARLSRLRLGPIGASMAERIVAAVLPDATAVVRARLVKRAGGNPLVLEELVRCAAEGQDQLPLTVQALVQQRLDRLPVEVRETVRAASVFGHYFWTGGLETLLDRDVSEQLEVAERAEIILKQDRSRVAGQQEWLFRQAMVREVAHESILPEDSRALHLSAGNWLEGAGSVDLGLIAAHLQRGDDLDRAASLFARATRQVMGNFGQMDTALELAQRGLDCGASGDDRAELLVTQAHIYNRQGRLSECSDAAEQVSQLAAPASPIWVDAQRLLSASLIEAGRSTEGDARLSWALGPQFLDKLQPEQRAVLFATRVRGLVDLNRPALALSVADEAVTAARQAGVLGEGAMMRALDARLFALMNACAPADAVAAGNALIQAADRAGDVHLASRGRANTASALNYLGCYEQAQALLDKALHDVRSYRLRMLEASCVHNVGMSRARQGELDKGIEAQRQATRIADELGGARLGNNAKVYEAMMLTWRGEPGDLRRAYELAQQSVEATRTLLALQIISLYILARVQLSRRQLPEALEAATEAHRRLGDGPVEEWDEHIRLVFVEALLASGKGELADEALRTAFEAIRQRAAAMKDENFRTSYTNRNDETRQLLELAHKRLGLAI
jgi:serine/threonine protein kinase/tetratricopeptide (TPR) repeat protein